VHFRRIEPFLTSGGGFLYFNHRMFGQTNFNFTAQLGDKNPGMDSHMVFVGVSFLR
jgi:hypothetical protein